MEEFFTKLSMFFGIVFLLSWTAQSVINVRINNRTVNGNDNLDIIKDKDYDLVFLGSSRCLAHFNPSPFEKSLGLKCVNIGVDGHSELPMDILRLSNYLTKNKSPKYVVLSFDPLVAAGSFVSNENFVSKNSFARYAYNCSAEDEPLVNYFKFNFAEKHMPLYALLKYKQFFDCLTLSNVDNRVIYGYERHDELWDTLSASTHPTIILNSYFADTPSDIDKIRDRLDSLRSLCVKNNISLICVQTPVYKDIYIKKTFDLTGKICQGIGVPFFDLNSDEINSNIINFYNADHLNTNGVNIMTNNLLSNDKFIRLVSRNG